MNEITKVWTIINNVCRQYRKVEKSREAVDILNEAEKEIFDIIDGLKPKKEPQAEYSLECDNKAYNYNRAIKDMEQNIDELKEGE